MKRAQGLDYTGTCRSRSRIVCNYNYSRPVFTSNITIVGLTIVIRPRRMRDMHYAAYCDCSWSVSQSVCLSVSHLRCAKTAKRIQVLSELETLEDRRNFVLNGGPDPPMARGESKAILPIAKFWSIARVRCGLRQITLALLLLPWQFAPVEANQRRALAAEGDRRRRQLSPGLTRAGNSFLWTYVSVPITIPPALTTRDVQ